MGFVEIGNPGNAADTSGTPILPGSISYPRSPGSVDYTYNIGKYEVSRDIITKANAEGNLGITLYDMTSYGGNGVYKPATGISWYQAAQFVNWLNTSTGGTAAYKFDASGNFQMWSSSDAGYNANNLFRNSLAKFFLPSTDEWYKAAYGSPNGTWYNYPTGSDSKPAAVAGGTTGAVYGQATAAGPADITNAGGLSRWGTMGQGGNASEWNETAYDGINNSAGENRAIRAGTWWSSTYGDELNAVMHSSADPTGDFKTFGFRVAMVPEPSSLSLLALGGVLVALGTRRRS